MEENWPSNAICQTSPPLFSFPSLPFPSPISSAVLFRRPSNSHGQGVLSLLPYLLHSSPSLFPEWVALALPLASASPAEAVPLSAAAGTLAACCGLQGSACVSPGGFCAAEGSGPQPEAPHCGGPVPPQQSLQPGWVPQQPPHAATSGASALLGESCHGQRSQIYSPNELLTIPNDPPYLDVSNTLALPSPPPPQP